MICNPYLIAFSNVPNIGPKRLKLILDFFGDAQNAWNAKEEIWQKIGLPKNVSEEFFSLRKVFDVSKYVDSVYKKGIDVISIDDGRYPQCLKEISDPPFLLYVKSLKHKEDLADWTKTKNIGVVGTRKITSYGKEVTEELTRGLACSGFTIISGMALGVDGVAHNIALKNEGKTIAVLGAGVDVIYPLEHRDLYQQIYEQGIILSEVAPSKTVNKGIFPARNRIISGLSQAVLVTEGAVDSGSLITANCALEQGREVFAVPGPINSAMAAGTNYLIKNGAKLVTGVKDILDDLGYSSDNIRTHMGKRVKGATLEEQKIINILSLESLSFDDLARKTETQANNLGTILAEMELSGLIKKKGEVFAIQLD